MKGVVLAGGTGSRLNPLTRVTNKHLLPIYDKPMVYYPIQTLVNAGIDEILLVTGGKNAGDFLRLLGNGRDFGLKHINYTYQEGEGGIAQALGLAEFFAGNESICVILGDNIIENNICQAVENFKKQGEGAKILLKEVTDAQRFGVAEIRGNHVLGIEEKPKNPKSNYAVIGIYLYDKTVFEKIRRLKPSGRGELEITDVNNFYIEEEQADVRSPGRLVDRCRHVRVPAARQQPGGGNGREQNVARSRATTGGAKGNGPMKIFVTGGAGFIGSNFIRHVLSLNKGYQIVNYDKLTYAGNLANLESVADDPNYSFVRGRHLRRHRGGRSHARLRCRGALRRRIARGPQHLRTRAGHRDQRDRYVCHAASRAQAAHRALRAHLHRRSVWRYAARAVCRRRIRRSRPAAPIRRPRPAPIFWSCSYVRTYGFPGLITRSSNNYGPYQFPEKFLPLMITNIFDDKPLPDLRRRQAAARLAARGRQLPRRAGGS